MTVPRLVLGVESSCDEMAAAVVRDGTSVLASRVHSQLELHRPYGGVVPELASRDHVRSVSQVVRAALERIGDADWDVAARLIFGISRRREASVGASQALQKIARGVYGDCEGCGEEIGLKRLEARPVAELCIDCKAEQEKAERHQG